jgi:molybdopterin-containing oxidoreductase family membrane subunit
MFSINPSLYGGHIMLCIIYLWALFKHKPRLVKVSAVTVVIWAICVHSGTAAIFGFVPRELYHSPLLPPSFVVAALASGAAFMILMLTGIFKATGRHIDDALIIWLGRLLSVFILVVIYFITIENLHRVYLYGSRDAALFYLFGGVHSLLFWLGMMLIGFIIPAIILFGKKRQRNLKWVVTASGLLVFGVLCERYMIVLPGLANPPELFPGMEIHRSVVFEGIVDYRTSGYEILQALGVLGAVGLIFLFGIKFMGFLPVEAREIKKIVVTEIPGRQASRPAPEAGV